MIQFTLTDIESKTAEDFIKEHKDCCREKLHKPFFSTTGGEFSYIITPTGLGNCVTIRCDSCGKEKEITDISNW